MPVWLLAIAHACLQAALVLASGLQPTSLNGYSAKHTASVRSIALVHLSKQDKTLMQLASVHVCAVRARLCLLVLQGCLVSYRPLEAAFVYSSKIPSMRCVTSRCVALNGCYYAAAERPARAGRASRVARYKSNDSVDKREEPKRLSHGHVLVRHATMQIWAA